MVLIVLVENAFHNNNVCSCCMFYRMPNIFPPVTHHCLKMKFSALHSCKSLSSSWRRYSKCAAYSARLAAATTDNLLLMWWSVVMTWCSCVGRNTWHCCFHYFEFHSGRSCIFTHVLCHVKYSTYLCVAASAARITRWLLICCTMLRCWIAQLCYSAEARCSISTCCMF